MRFLKSSRTHLLLLAASIFTISTILGLSAYLADKKTYTSNFRTVTDDELGFSFTGSELSDQLLTPGVPFPMSVGVKVAGPSSIYAFIDLKPSASLIISGLNTSTWHPIAKDSTIYYYGTDDALVPLDKTNNPSAEIFSSVSIPKDVKTGESFSLEIIGYAIQSDLVGEDMTPSNVFELAKSNYKEPTAEAPATAPEGGD